MLRDVVCLQVTQGRPVQGMWQMYYHELFKRHARSPFKGRKGSAFLPMSTPTTPLPTESNDIWWTLPEVSCYSTPPATTVQCARVCVKRIHPHLQQQFIKTTPRVSPSCMQITPPSSRHSGDTHGLTEDNFNLIQKPN